MPHVIVKLNAGRSEDLKRKLSDAVTQAVMSSLDLGADAVSVSLEEFPAESWMKEVYEPDIVNGKGQLYKKPGYGPR